MNLMTDLGFSKICGLGIVALCGALACSAGDAASARVLRASPIAPKLDPAAPAETQAFVVGEPPVSDARAQPSEDGTRLVYSHVAANIRGGSVVTHVTDVVSNDGAAPIDFSYIFPLPTDATVTELAYFSGGKRVRAEAKEKDDAKATFEAAKARGDSATLSESQGRSRFSVSLTPLAAGESRRVELEYVQTLDSFGAQRSFVFPAAHSERRGEPALDFQVDIEGQAAVSGVASLNHPDARVVRLGARNARVLLSTSEAPLRQDLVVRWSERSEPQQLALRAVAGKDGEAGFGQVDFAFNADDLAAQSPSRDFVFVLDTSLSMAGEALEHGKRLIERAVGLLTERDRLALVEFDDRLSSWSELVPASARNRDRALSELRPKRASGLSNVEAAIDRARELTSNSSNPVVVLVTDGQSTLGDDPDALRPASKPADFSATQVFVALVNYPSRQPALEALFTAPTLRFLPSGEAGRQTADAMAELVAAPVLENVKLDISGLDPQESYGTQPRRLALGERIRVLGRLSGAPFEVRASATLHGRPLSFTQTASLSSRPSDQTTLPREWARTKLAGLETHYRADRDDASKAAAIELAKQFGLISSLTSLVAVDTVSPDRVAPGDPELRIRAPRSASSVVATLPWGGEVRCAWDETEGLWFGRFLVPRTLGDGVHKLSIFSTMQGRKQRRGSLLLRVDSRAPQYRLRATRRDGLLQLLAEPVAEVFDKSGDALRLDLVDVKHVSVELRGQTHALTLGAEGVWSGTAPLPGAGDHAASLVATDYAQNSSRRRSRLSIAKSGEVRLVAIDEVSRGPEASQPEPATATARGGDVFAPGNVSALATFEGRLIVATFDDGVFSVDARGGRHELRGAPRFVNTLLAEPGRLFMGSTEGLFELSGGELKPRALPRSARHVNGLTRGRDGTLWLATSGGLIGLSGGDWRHVEGLPSRIVYAVAESADGALWAGTAAGLARITASGIVSFSVDDGALPHRWVTALLAEDGGVLVGTYQGGITRVGPRGAEPLAATRSLWLNPHGITRVAGHLYAASMGGGLVTIDAAGETSAVALPSADVTAVQAFAGALWVGTRDGLVRLAEAAP
jgi:Ca-activated chloride channel family protein